MTSGGVGRIRRTGVSGAGQFDSVDSVMLGSYAAAFTKRMRKDWDQNSHLYSMSLCDCAESWALGTRRPIFQIFLRFPIHGASTQRGLVR